MCHHRDEIADWNAIADRIEERADPDEPEPNAEAEEDRPEEPSPTPADD